MYAVQAISLSPSLMIRCNSSVVSCRRK